MIAHTVNNTILFYHPETGCYNIETFIPHKELFADVVIGMNNKFYLSKWHKHHDGKYYNSIGVIE